jgi:hypothetical protein
MLIFVPAAKGPALISVLVRRTLTNWPRPGHFAVSFTSCQQSLVIVSGVALASYWGSEFGFS